MDILYHEYYASWKRSTQHLYTARKWASKGARRARYNLIYHGKTGKDLERIRSCNRKVVGGLCTSHQYRISSASSIQAVAILAKCTVLGRPSHLVVRSNLIDNREGIGL